MNGIQGKQIADHTITQQNLSLTAPSGNTDAATKEYVDSNISVEHLSIANKNMQALSTSGHTGVTLACSTKVLENPVANSQVRVLINNITIDVGPGKEAFFSADSGLTARAPGEVAWGDYLYWDKTHALYDLEDTDTVDFEYLIHGDSTVDGVIDGGVI